MNIQRTIQTCFIITGLLLSQGLAAQRMLTLEQARQQALARNNKLKIAQQNIEGARTQKAQADAAGRPKLDGSVTGFYFGNPLNTLLPEYGISPGLSLSQPIYSGGKIRLGKEAAAKGIEIWEEQKALSAAEVLFNTESAWWQVVSVREKIRLAEQFKRQLDGLYNELNNSYQAGLIYKNDLLRVKVQSNENELALTKARDGLVLAKLHLAQVTGMADSTDFILADTMPGNFNTVQPDTALQQIMGNRPEIKILQRSLEAERIQANILKADLRPSVGLSLNGITAFGKQGINPGSNSNSLATYYGLLSVNIPIFDWGIRKQKVRQQQYRISAQEFQLKETKEQISLEVQQAWLQLNQSAKRIELSSTSLEQANENLRLSNDRLQAGTITGKDVLEAQTIWQQAYSNMIDAKVEYMIHEAGLRKALGR